MPTVTLNRKSIAAIIGKYSDTVLKERIGMLGTDLESIDHDNIVVEIFPNRPDMLSEHGFARALGYFLGKQKPKKYTVYPSDYTVTVDRSVTMRPYTACAVVKGLQFTDDRIREIMQAQEKLATTHGRRRKKSAYGIYPLEKIHFPIQYIAKDPSKVEFQPLGFDKPVHASEVLQSHTTGKEYAHLTTGWKKYPFFIDNTGQVLSMLPFTNAELTGKVSTATRDIFIECTGTDRENVEIALNILVTMFADMGGKVYTVKVTYSEESRTTPDLAPKILSFDKNYATKLLGVDINDELLKQCCEKMGLVFLGNRVEVPAYRADVLHMRDIIGDIGIGYGFEHFREEIPQLATIGNQDRTEKLLYKFRELMVGAGLTEVRNYHLLSLQELQQKMNVQRQPIRLKTTAEENAYLRNSIIPSLLRVLAQNTHHLYPQNIFEIGKIFFKGDTETGVVETPTLSIAVCSEEADFTKIKQTTEAVLRSLGIESKTQPLDTEYCIPGRCAKIVAQEDIGILGEIAPQVLENWGINMPVAVCEFDLSKILALLPRHD